MSSAMDKPEPDVPQLDDAWASTSRQIVLDERRHCQNSELIFIALNRTLFLVLDAMMIILGRTPGISVAYFLLIAAALCVVWYWEIIQLRAKLRIIGELVTQVEFQEYGQLPSAKSWVDALIQLGYQLNYGASVFTSSRWRLAEPAIWLLVAVANVALLHYA
jgi:hypothetical protein